MAASTIWSFINIFWWRICRVSFKMLMKVYKHWKYSTVMLHSRQMFINDGTEKCIVLRQRGAFDGTACSQEFMAVCEGIKVCNDLFQNKFTFSWTFPPRVVICQILLRHIHWLMDLIEPLHSMILWQRVRWWGKTQPFSKYHHRLITTYH